jgi:hypothetical protein
MAAYDSNGTIIGCVVLLSIPNVSWSAYLLNKIHLQIKFTLKNQVSLTCKAMDSIGCFITMERPMRTR